MISADFLTFQDEGGRWMTEFIKYVSGGGCTAELTLCASVLVLALTKQSPFRREKLDTSAHSKGSSSASAGASVARKAPRKPEEPQCSVWRSLPRRPSPGSNNPQ